MCVTLPLELRKIILFASSPEELIARVIAALLGMTVHEFAHNYVGHLMGDPVPAREGRLTLNPMVHINWFGFLMFVLIGFGPLGSAPISPYRMRNPRWGFLYAVAAGPVSNLILAALVAIPIRFIGLDNLFNNVGGLSLLGEVLITLIYFNVLLFVFNLLPLFPLDGWHIVLSLLPPDLAYTWQRYQQYSYYAFFGLILLSFFPLGGFNILSILIGQPTNAILGFLLGV
jgi:Zn-dependent protease